LRELDFAHVEVTDATNLEVFVNDLRKVMVKTGTTTGERTVGVFRWVFERTMSKKSAAVGTGAIAFRPLVDIVAIEGESMLEPKFWVNLINSHG
jgi:hypothetical protein